MAETGRYREKYREMEQYSNQNMDEGSRQVKSQKTLQVKYQESHQSKSQKTRQAKCKDISTDMYKMAISKMMAICSSKEQCRSDILKKLEDYGLGVKEQEKLIVELEKERFIDETRYARAFVNDKFRYNDWGKIKIASQLKMKQIPGNIIVEALGTIDGELYFETIKKLLEEKRRGIKAKNRFDMGAKLFRYGLSKGFESELLYKLINLSADEE